MKMRIEAMGSEHADALLAYLRDRPNLPNDWDRTLNADAACRYLALNIERDRDAGTAFIALDADRVDGVATLVPHEWNTRFFETPCGQVTHFLSRSHDAAGALAQAVTGAIRDQGMRHVFTAPDVRERWVTHALQAQQWRFTWACMKIVCDPADVDTVGFSPRQGDLEVVPHDPSHLPELLAIAERLTDYSWLQWEESLHGERRRTYIARLTESCCQGGFADVNFTLLENGRPVGHISSAMIEYPRSIRDGCFSYRRNIFVDPDKQSIGYARMMGMTAALHDQGVANRIFGRVRLEGAAMFRMVQNIGFRMAGGEIYLVYDR